MIHECINQIHLLQRTMAWLGRLAHYTSSSSVDMRMDRVLQGGAKGGLEEVKVLPSFICLLNINGIHRIKNSVGHATWSHAS